MQIRFVGGKNELMCECESDGPIHSSVFKPGRIHWQLQRNGSWKDDLHAIAIFVFTFYFEVVWNST